MTCFNFYPPTTLGPSQDALFPWGIAGGGPFARSRLPLQGRARIPLPSLSRAMSRRLSRGQPWGRGRQSRASLPHLFHGELSAPTRQHPGHEPEGTCAFTWHSNPGPFARQPNARCPRPSRQRRPKRLNRSENVFCAPKASSVCVKERKLKEEKDKRDNKDTK